MSTGNHYEKYARADLNTLQQLIDLFVRHLLPELCKHISQLSGTNESVAFFIEYLETADEFLYRSLLS
jgi:hypothetical protein